MPAVAPERLAQAIKRSQSYIISQQWPEGYWVGELEANTTPTSEDIVFCHLVGWRNNGRQTKCGNYV